jgi:hypothetical protein
MNEKIKTELKDRLSFETVGLIWRKVRNVSASLSAILFIVPNLPIDFSDSNKAWMTGIAAILGVVAGVSHLDKSNK